MLLGELCQYEKFFIDDGLKNTLLLQKDGEKHKQWPMKNKNGESSKKIAILVGGE